MKIKRIIASEIATLDSDVRTGGGTDVTAALQAALDEALACGGVRLVMDGAALVRSLHVHSNTTIECLTPDCGFFQKAQSNRAIVSNANWDRYSLKDRNIALIGGTYNQDCRNQAHDVPWVDDAPHRLPTQDPQSGGTPGGNRWVYGLEFYGVENLLVRDVLVRDFRTFALTVGGFRNVLCENVWFDLPNRLHAQNQDGFHFWGPGRFLTVRNVGGRVGDDFMNIGPDEVDGVSDIADVLVDGVLLDDADQGIRMLSCGTGRLDRVTVRNVSGTYRSFGFFLNPRMPWEQKRTYGNFGNIFFENIDLRQTAPNYDYIPPVLFSIGGNVECMTFKNIRHHHPCDSRTLFEMACVLQTIIIDGLTVIEESDAAAGTEYIQVRGEVERLMVSNATVLRAPGLQSSGTLVAMKEGGKLGTLHLSHVHAEGLETLVANEEQVARTVSHQVEMQTFGGHGA
jgi:hypothetical protein